MPQFVMSTPRMADAPRTSVAAGPLVPLAQACTGLLEAFAQVGEADPIKVGVIP